MLGWALWSALALLGWIRWGYTSFMSGGGWRKRIPAAPAMPVVMSHKMNFISLFALDINEEFHYNRYFSMLPVGPDPRPAISEGFFDIVNANKEKLGLKTIALAVGDGEATRNTADGARVNLKIRLLADGSDNDSQPLRPRGIQKKKRKAAVAGDEAEVHGEHREIVLPRCVGRSRLSETGSAPGGSIENSPG